MELGASTLLIDEDTCATNFMIRDTKMVRLVSPDKEPITPFIRRVRDLHEKDGVSSVIVVGGSGDYLNVADHVIMMDSYRCLDVTARAREVVTESEEGNGNGGGDNGTSSTSRAPGPGPSSAVRRRPEGDAFRPVGKVNVRSRTVMSYGDDEVNDLLELGGLEQIIDVSQTRTVSLAMQRIPSLTTTVKVVEKNGSKNSSTLNSSSYLTSVLRALSDRMGGGKVGAVLDETLAPEQFRGDLAVVRGLEIGGAMNRLRRNKNFDQINSNEI